MLMLLMALSVVVIDRGTKQPEYGHEKRTEVFVVNLKPTWRVCQVTLANKDSLKSSDESNLEHWRNLIQTDLIEVIAPKQAVMNPNAGLYRNNRSGFTMVPPFRSHCPWQSPVLRYLPEFDEVGTGLYFELVTMPSIRKPYYEGIVSVMPTIRCKAKTIELLQEQLLQQYSQYLTKMLQDEEDFPHQQQNIRLEHQGLNGAFIAWLIGQSSATDKNNNQLTQIIPTPAPNQWPWVQFGY